MEYTLPKQLQEIIGREAIPRSAELDELAGGFDNTILAVESGGAWFDLAWFQGGRAASWRDLKGGVKALMGRNGPFVAVLKPGLLFVFDGPPAQAIGRLRPLPRRDGTEYQAIVDARKEASDPR